MVFVAFSLPANINKPFGVIHRLFGSSLCSSIHFLTVVNSVAALLSGHLWLVLQDLVLTRRCMEMNLANTSAASLRAGSRTRPECVSTLGVCPHTPVQQHLFFIPSLWLEVLYHRDDDELALLTCAVYARLWLWLFTPQHPQ